MQNAPYACLPANKPFYTTGFKGNPATHLCSTVYVCLWCVHLSVYFSVHGLLHSNYATTHHCSQT